MDPTRFDELTRDLGTSTSRRAVFKGLAAGLAGALGMARLTDAAPRGNIHICKPTGSPVRPWVPLYVPQTAANALLARGATRLGTNASCTACGDVCTGGTICTSSGCAQPCVANPGLCTQGQVCDAQQGCIAACTLGTDTDCAACGDACTGTTTCSGGTCVQRCTLDASVCTSAEVCDATQGCLPGTCATYRLDPATQCSGDTANGCATSNPLSTGDEAPTINGYRICTWSCPDPNNYWAWCDNSGCSCQHYD